MNKITKIFGLSALSVSAACSTQGSDPDLNTISKDIKVVVDRVVRDTQPPRIGQQIQQVDQNSLVRNKCKWFPTYYSDGRRDLTYYNCDGIGRKIGSMDVALGPGEDQTVGAYIHINCNTLKDCNELADRSNLHCNHYYANINNPRIIFVCTVHQDDGTEINI